MIFGIGLVGALVAHAGAPVIINPGTPDAAMRVYDPALGRAHVVQLACLCCVGRRDVVFFEDGSREPYQELLAQESGRTDHGDARETLVRRRAAWALASYHPTGNSFIPTEIEE